MTESKASLIARAARLSPGRRRLLAEAFAMLVVSALAVRLLPFRRAIRLGALRLGAPAEGGDRLVGDCASAVHSAARFSRGRAVCIHKGIAVQRLLRKRGLDAVLHYGIGKDEADSLKAHVWVSVGGDIVMGGEEAADFREVAVYP